VRVKWNILATPVLLNNLARSNGFFSGLSRIYLSELMSLWVPVGVILPRLSPSLDSSMPDWREGGRDCRLPGVTPDEFDEPYCYWEASYYCNSPLSIKTTKLLSPGFVSAIPSAFVTIDFDTLSVLGVDLSKFSFSLRF